ncbi:MAG: hypothetical protein GY847_04230 [Proteobacteria bacterium]|nr:hypothetical protein [Pseudomonadota bacterium]
MKRDTSHLKALETLRRRDRAAAFEALGKAERAFDKSEFNLAETRNKIASTEAALNSMSITDGVSADWLQMDSLNKERLTTDLKGLRRQENYLAEQVRETAVRLDVARDVAANAHRAVTVLADDINEES